MPHPIRLPQSPAGAVVLVGTGVALADMAVATGYFFLKAGVPPLNIVKGISGGWVGREAARAGGAEMVLLGALSHLGLALAMVAVYWIASWRLPALTARPLACGLAYGVATWAAMKFVVVPLSALGAGSGGKDLLWQALHFGSHLFIVGLPSAYLARALQVARAA
jgi:hypothetical protein